MLRIFILFANACSASVNLISSNGSPPCSRYSLNINYIQAFNSLIVFGGNDDLNIYNDLWNYSLSLNRWENIQPMTSLIPGIKIIRLMIEFFYIYKQKRTKCNVFIIRQYL